MQWLRSVGWLGAVASASVAIAFASAALQRAGLAPLLLSSLLTGAALGAVAIGIAWVFDVKNGRLLIAGTVMAPILLVTMQHFALYRFHLNDWDQVTSEKPELSLFREPPPESLWVYLRQEAAQGRGWLWLLDGAIVTGAAAGVAVALRSRRGEGNME
ncbi:MAG: hypothetical protein WD851_02025 [Pirellulales bacterium]